MLYFISMITILHIIIIIIIIFIIISSAPVEEKRRGEREPSSPQKKGHHPHPLLPIVLGSCVWHLGLGQVLTHGWGVGEGLVSGQALILVGGVGEALVSRQQVHGQVLIYLSLIHI